jgi:hypothetical protein
MSITVPICGALGGRASTPALSMPLSMFKAPAMVAYGAFAHAFRGGRASAPNLLTIP